VRAELSVMAKVSERLLLQSRFDTVDGSVSGKRSKRGHDRLWLVCGESPRSLAKDSGVEIVAAADTQLDRAQRFAARAYSSAEGLLDREQLDFVDIATHATSHLPLVRLAVERKVPTICQKPIAPDWASAVQLVSAAEAAGVRLMIHETWRWQPWYRVAQEMISRGDIGSPIGYGFRFRRRDGLGDEPYTEQAYFRKEPKLIIHVTLVHHIDTARFLFGEIDSIYAEASRRNPVSSARTKR